ncbi:MAG: HI0074 family nucleotidyltransferase substrate-binding subunit [Candidatus Gastranaerophilales bacterium]
MNIRWCQRFQNYKKAQVNLVEMIGLYRSKKDIKAYKLALIQAFEMSVELAWKVLKDYLNYLQFNVQAPRDAVKQAFSIGLIDNGLVFISMIEDRNAISHVSDEVKADEIVKKIDEIYFEQLMKLEVYFDNKLNELGNK